MRQRSPLGPCLCLTPARTHVFSHGPPAVREGTAGRAILPRLQALKTIWPGRALPLCKGQGISSRLQCMQVSSRHHCQRQSVLTYRGRAASRLPMAPECSTVSWLGSMKAFSLPASQCDWESLLTTAHVGCAVRNIKRARVRLQLCVGSDQVLILCKTAHMQRVTWMSPSCILRPADMIRRQPLQHCTQGGNNGTVKFQQQMPACSPEVPAPADRGGSASIKLRAHARVASCISLCFCVLLSIGPHPQEPFCLSCRVADCTSPAQVQP